MKPLATLIQKNNSRSISKKLDPGETGGIARVLSPQTTQDHRQGDDGIPSKSKRIKSSPVKSSSASLITASIWESLQLLKASYPDAHCALEHKNPFELLIATILSAQCTDDRVNIVTRELFKVLPTPVAFMNASLEEIEKLIHSTGFYRNKAKNIKSCCQDLVQKHQGLVPQTMDDLVALAGVGRKTANVVLGNAFQIPSGIVVDTHVGRLTNRMGWLKSKDPLKIELILMKLIDKKDWIMLSHYLIAHGRKVCKARSPQCNSCFLIDRCPKKGV